MNEIKQAVLESLKPTQNLAKNLKQSANVATDNLKSLQRVLDGIDSGNIVYKSSLTRVIKKNRKMFYELLQQEAVKAAKSSIEYDYGPYLERLIDSIDLAEMSVRVSGKSLLVKINLSPLGEIQDWGKAVVQVRRNPANLASRKKKVGGENAARFYWRTRIYQTERYDQTIADQLSLVNGAPFWYLIENGNANPPGFQVVAPAYPKVKPQRFIEKTERRIKEFINGEIQALLPTIENEWIDFIANKLGLKITTKLRLMIQEYGFNLSSEISNLKEVDKLSVNDIVGKISTERKQFDIIVTSKSLGLRGRLK